MLVLDFEAQKKIAILDFKAWKNLRLV